jgi:hypothetical protein
MEKMLVWKAGSTSSISIGNGAAGIDVTVVIVVVAAMNATICSLIF